MNWLILAGGTVLLAGLALWAISMFSMRRIGLTGHGLLSVSQSLRATEFYVTRPKGITFREFMKPYPRR
jgi:hypothetical protein